MLEEELFHMSAAAASMSLATALLHEGTELLAKILQRVADHAVIQAA